MKLKKLTEKECRYTPQRRLFNGWIDAINNNTSLLSTPKRIYPYLYTIDVDAIDYNYANEYCEKTYDPKYKPGACSSVRRGNVYGRNFDWYLDNSVEFVVRTTPAEGRYASIGVGGALVKLSKEDVESHKWDDDRYRLVPFFLDDGINEKGVFININVVNKEDNNIATTGTNPGKPRLSSFQITRYVLDHFATAREAVDFLKNGVDIYCASSPTFAHYEFHYMIGDENDTFIVEFINNKCVVIEAETGVTPTDFDKTKAMTNFYLTGTELKTEGGVTIVDPETLTNLACGVERYNNAIKEYDNLTGVDEMIKFMSGYNAEGTPFEDTNLRYTNLFTRDPATDFANYWGTEFAGKYIDETGQEAVLTAKDLIEQETSAKGFDPEVLAAMKEYIAGFDPTNREDGTYWQTVHSCTYDIKARVLYIVTQEGQDAKGMAFCINKDLDYLFNKDYEY